MDNQFEYTEEEELRSARRRQRIAEMKREKEKCLRIQQNIKRYGVYVGVLILAVVLIGGGVAIFRRNAKAKETENSKANYAVTENDTVTENIATQEKEIVVEESKPQAEAETSAIGAEEAVPEGPNPEGSNPVGPNPEGSTTQPAATDAPIPVGEVTFRNGYEAEITAETRNIGAEDVLSEYAVLINAEDGTIAAQREAMATINPASMTKVLTVLVAAEHITDLDDEFTMTLEITDYAYVNDCSSVGFLDGEVVTVRDLFYGTVLPSGGDAAVALATYVAGSHEAFVDMMNEKLEELGLSDTAHFTNCVGLYDKEHYCSVYDMAMIMKAAVENDLCREVLSARTYTTSATEQHPEGITISNWFIRRIEDKDTGGRVLCAKTGYVAQSGSCAASYGISEEGTPYICVTAQTYSSWRCIYDHVALYSKYTL